MTETFLFVRLGEGEVYRNVAWKLQKCHDRVGGDDDDVDVDDVDVDHVESFMAIDQGCLEILWQIKKHHQ